MASAGVPSLGRQIPSNKFPLNAKDLLNSKITPLGVQGPRVVFITLSHGAFFFGEIFKELKYQNYINFPCLEYTIFLLPD